MIKTKKTFLFGQIEANFHDSGGGNSLPLIIQGVESIPIAPLQLQKPTSPPSQIRLLSHENSQDPLLQSRHFHITPSSNKNHATLVCTKSSKSSRNLKILSVVFRAERKNLRKHQYYKSLRVSCVSFLRSVYQRPCHREQRYYCTKN